MTNKSISLACETVGGLSILARIIGVKPPTVHQWITGKRPVPIERCAAIENATTGKVTRRDLRPNDWQEIWPELKELSHA